MKTAKDQMPYEEYILDYIKFAASASLPAQLVADMNISTTWQPMVDNLVLMLSTRVLSDSLDERDIVLEHKVPATWWQHTKEVHFPTFSRWLKRPVQYKTLEKRVSVRTLATFPEARLRYPENLGRVRIAQHVTTYPQEWKNPTTEG